MHPTTTVLLRQYLAKALAAETGYFQSTCYPRAGALSQAMPWRDFAGRKDAEIAMAMAHRQCRQSRSAWLTPGELFAPHYGAAFAQCATSMHRKRTMAQGIDPGKATLRVVEVGAGRGGLARGATAYLQQIGASQRWEYVCTDVSEASLKCLEELQGVQTLQMDATDPEQWKKLASDAHTFVIATEVLDNLPHDRVERNLQGQWMETNVSMHPEADPTTRPSMELRPLQDPLVQRCFGHLPVHAHENSAKRSWMNWLSRLQQTTTMQKNESAVLFLPTTCLQMLEGIHQALPSHTLIAQDFNVLPDIKISGKNAPLVVKTRIHQLQEGQDVGDLPDEDLDTFLLNTEETGQCDVLFPTDFDWLSILFQNTAKSQNKPCFTHHASAREFLEAFGDVYATSTRSGYNPMLEEFPNTRVFIGQALSQR
mmetsp:Transcript_10649/g.65641  ORF Transcript_10649/g.65641 Transcript_10649/m.65641 type:complete len:425 (+) Transcript_10649:2709-3983(+)